jgi:AefR-like transcriptional repressor, C-terminal domain
MMSGIRENAPIFRILLSALPRMDQKMREQYCRQVILYAVGVLQAYLQEQTQRGVLQPDLDPAILALALVGMFFPSVLIHDVLQLETLHAGDYERVISTCVGIFLHGTLTEPCGKETIVDVDRFRPI